MEYLNDLNEKLKMDETGIIYHSIFTDCPELVCGSPFFGVKRNFSKFSSETIREINDLTFTSFGSEDARKKLANNFLGNLDIPTGCCIRFKTNSDRIILKAAVRRNCDIMKATLWCSSGFDIYVRPEGESKWIHKNIIGPMTGHDKFAECSGVPAGGDVMIYLPVYNQVTECFIGSRAPLEPIAAYRHPVPLAFYGNSGTQGASATRPGLTHFNIISRELDIAIANYSASNGCHGQLSVAKTIGEINICALVIDYSHNASSAQELKATHERFYLEIRKYHPYIPVIFLTTPYIPEQYPYREFDAVIHETFNNAKARGENVYLIQISNLLDEYGMDLTTVDHTHHTDFGMNIIAQEIEKILIKALGL